MNTINISQKTKNKHLDFSHYEFIINSLIQFNASHSGKRNIGKTQFVKQLALSVGTSVSNVYSIIKDATVSIKDTHLNVHFELSALAAFQKRSKNHKIPNNSKFDKAKESISIVENEIKSNKLSSIDETINYLILHRSDEIASLETVSTKTFYNYVRQGRTSIKPIDLPRMVRRKTKKNWKTYIPKRQKGTSITERPDHINDRASDENCNALVRYFIKKGTDINTIDKKVSIDINNKINQKKRKILGYLPAEKLFLDELTKINVTENTIFYKN